MPAPTPTCQWQLRPNFAGPEAVAIMAEMLGESASSDLALLAQAVRSFGLLGADSPDSGLSCPDRASAFMGRLGLSDGHVLDWPSAIPTAVFLGTSRNPSCASEPSR